MLEIVIGEFLSPKWSTSEKWFDVTINTLQRFSVRLIQQLDQWQIIPVGDLGKKSTQGLMFDVTRPIFHAIYLCRDLLSVIYSSVMRTQSGKLCSSGVWRFR
ncbi:MAG: hypothetical protein HGA87_04935, partial [Desulfobulbaceae bacterium]|nr:hypothetical protein [Desulfobulbaceae bacterium]